MNTFNLALDLDKRGGVAQWVTLRQGDRRGTELRATIYDHGTQAGGGYTCRVSIRLPGEGNEYYRETATYTNGVAVVTVDEEYAAAIVGVTEGYFELLQGDAVIASTESFGVRILRSAQDGAVPGDKYDSAIEDALAELDEATGRISQMVIDATEEYLEAHPELTTTVEDNSLTDAKLIQHGGILDRVARLWHRLDNLLTSTPAEADSLTVTDAAKTPMAGLALYGRSTQSGTPTPSAPVAIESVEGNLAKGYTATATNNGITYVTTEGGATTISGTASGGSAMPLQTAGTFALPAGTYTLVMGGELTASGTGARAQLVKVVGSSISNVSATPYTTGGGTVSVTFTTSEDMTALVRIGVNSGSVVSGTLQFALYEGSVAYPPTTCGGVGLWARGRNLLDTHGNNLGDGTLTIKGITFTRNADGSVSASGTATDAMGIIIGHASLKAAKTYTMGASPAGASNTTYFLNAAPAFTDLANVNVYTTPYTATANVDKTVAVYIYVRNGQTLNNVTFYPCIYEGSSATTYQPYAESTTPIPLQGHALRSLPDGTRDEVTVDQYGHAVLTQRVASATFSGASSEGWEVQTGSGGNRFRVKLDGLPSGASLANEDVVDYIVCDHFKTTCDSKDGNSGTFWGEVGISARRNADQQALIYHEGETLAEWQTWLASNPITIIYGLATPVTIDLGTIDPVALQGPDMTAQAVPTAPFALTYERDLNVTLSRLEAAIAEVATS